MNYKCECCDVSFRTPNDKTRHMLTSKHLKNAGLKPPSDYELENNELKTKLKDMKTDHLIELMKAHHKIELLEQKNEMLERMLTMNISKEEPIQENKPVQENKHEPIKKPEPIKKSEPNWTPEVGFEDVLETISINYEVIDDYVFENEYGKMEKNYADYVNDVFIGEKQITDYVEHNNSPFEINILKEVYEKGADDVIIQEVVRRIKKANIIQVKDASRSKYLLYSYGKWCSKDEGDNSLLEIANVLELEIRHQHRTYIECCSRLNIDVDFAKKAERSSFTLKSDTFIKKVLLCL